MKLIKLEVYVFDHENYGAADYKIQIENMRHMMATVKHSETVEIGDFPDSHELNQSTTPIERYRSYFKEVAPALATQPQAPQGGGTDGWIEWNGGSCPVDPAVIVHVRLRDPDPDLVDDEARPASEWSWVHTDDEYDIVAYRLAPTETPEAGK